MANFSVRAQYLITPMVPAPTFAFNDLWHFSVTRSTADNMNHFYVSLRVFSDNSQLQVKSNTATLALPVGTHYYTTSNILALQPFTTSFYNGGLLQQVVSSGGTFPPGSYVFVYTLYGRANDGEFTPLCEETVSTTVEAMWPPMLLSPADGDSINTVYPLLTWTPAFSSTYVGIIEYTLNLAEVLPGQNANQALLANPGYFSQNTIPVTMLPYPAVARTLEAGKTYAWQVHANIGGTSLGSSEVWSFFLATPASPSVSRLPKHYFKLYETVPAEFVQIKDSYLPIAIEERYHSPESKLRFILYDEAMKPVGTEKDFGDAIKAGLNLYRISVCSTNSKLSLKKGKYYMEVFTEKKKRLFLAFELQKGNCHEN